MKRVLRTIALIFFVALIIFAPLMLAKLHYPASPKAALMPADTALVFGAVVRNGQISPLHAQRLNAAVDLYNSNIVASIVVSNTSDAADAMRHYLVQQGIPESAIEWDGAATHTPDTCGHEIAHHQPRSVIFISQGFHLARLAYQCDRVGLTGTSIAAEAYATAALSTLSPTRIFTIRSKRHIREAILLWSAVLGIYDRL